jgi:hypothetical protein
MEWKWTKEELRKNIPEAIKAYFAVESHIVKIFPELTRPDVEEN